MGSRKNHARALILSISVAVLLTTLVLSNSSKPVNSESRTYSSGYDPHGGYIDWLIFQDFGSYSDAENALQTGQAHALYHRLYYPSANDFQTNSEIEFSAEPGTVNMWFHLNCQRFPTNLTGYRMALAQALDKHAVVQEVIQGYAQVLDNPIPLAYEFWSFENQMTSHFYDEDIVGANATLDATHIIDPVGDPNHPHPGWRFYDVDMSGNWTAGDKRGDIDAPLGLKIELIVYGSLSAPFRPQLIQLAGMEKCGLQGATVHIDDLPYRMADGEYNFCYLGTAVSPPGDPIFLYDYFHSEGFYNGGGGSSIFYNFSYPYFNYYSAEYDYNCTQFINAPTRLEARNWAWNCCRILLDEMPVIGCFNEDILQAYRTDLWEGYVNPAGLNRIWGHPFSLHQVRLKEEAGGPFGCVPTQYVVGFESYTSLWTLNPLHRGDYRGGFFEQLYSQLWCVDPLDPNTSAAPDLAWNWTLEPTTLAGDIQNGMKYTFQLFDNITWHDGIPFTSEDVQYSLMNIHPMSRYPGSTNEKVASIYRVDTPDDYTVEVYSNSTGYVTFSEATSVPIFPKHVWLPYESSNFSWTPQTAYDFTGTGCFRWVSHLGRDFFFLARYPSWHFAVEHPTRPNCPPALVTEVFVFGGVTIIILVISLSVLLFQRFTRQRKKGDGTK